MVTAFHENQKNKVNHRWSGQPEKTHGSVETCLKLEQERKDKNK
jgi:hypothetical protein